MHDPETGGAVSLKRSSKSNAETLVLETTRRAEQGFPFTTRINIDRSEFQELSAVPVEEKEGRTTYAIRHESEQQTAESPRVTLRSYPGPGAAERTYYGTFKQQDSEKEYRLLSLGGAEVVVIILLAGALLCAGSIAVGAIKHDCANKCASNCGGGQNVKSCKADIDVKIKASLTQVKINCSHSCKTTCKPDDSSGSDSGDSTTWWPDPPQIPGEIPDETPDVPGPSG